MAEGIILLIVFAFGACVGSFLNVVVYRLPAGMSIIYPPSHCPKCSHPLGITENIPIFGWLWLKGKCRWCKASISPRYPLVEATTAFLFSLIYHQFGFSWLTLTYLLLVSWLIPLALIDIDTMTLPNSLTQSGLIVGLIWQGLVGLADNGINGFAYHLFLAILGGVVGIWLFDIISIVGSLLLGKPAMGGGDPKLAAMIGVWVGWQGILLTAFLACAYGTIVGITAIALKLIRRQQPIPFGPFLVLACITVIFWGDRLINSYLEYMGI